MMPHYRISVHIFLGKIFIPYGAIDLKIKVKIINIKDLLLSLPIYFSQLPFFIFHYFWT